MYVGHHVKYPLYLSILMTLSDISNFMKSVHWEQSCPMWMDRQTHDKANSCFFKFCKYA